MVESQKIAESEKVDFHIDVNWGNFGILRPELFTYIAASEKVMEVTKFVLKQYCFPSLHVTFSSSGRLIQKDQETLNIDARLKQMEVRFKINGFKKTEKSGSDELSESPDDRCTVLGIYPFESNMDQLGHPICIPVDISSLLAANQESLSESAGLLSSLGLTFVPQLNLKFPLLEKAFLAQSREFGWYLNTQNKDQREGIHYGMAFLQVHRDVSRLKIEYSYRMDWEGYGINVIVGTKEKSLMVLPPSPPNTPQLTDFSNIDSLPPIIPWSDVKDLLGLKGSSSTDEMNTLIQCNRLVAFGKDNKHITKGSLLQLLGLNPH
jgi:hypothetical protein